MKFKIISLILLSFSLSLCKSPSSPGVKPTAPRVKPTAVVIITVTRTPILMEWSSYTELWWMEPIVSVSETGGVGVNVTEAKLEFVYKNRTYEPQTVAGGRLNANQSKRYYLSVGTDGYGYESVRFSVTGTDDNGHHIFKEKDFALHYVQWWLVGSTASQ